MTTQDEYVEGCDYFIHDMYDLAGAFCPCTPQAEIDHWFQRMRFPRHPMSNIRVVNTIPELFALLSRGEMSPGEVIGCAHCPWMGTTTRWVPHLLACPDQTATGLPS